MTQPRPDHDPHVYAGRLIPARGTSALRSCSWLVAPLLLALCGCPPRQVDKPFDPIPVAEAVALHNANAALVQGTLQARGGQARGHFTDNTGRQRAFDYDAALLLGPPRLMRLDMTALGRSCLLIGSSATRYWIVVKPQINTLWWGRHDGPVNPRAEELLIRPDLIPEAFGLTPLPVATTGPQGPLQRLTAEHQQLLFLDSNQEGQVYIAREYWLRRRAPQVVERIIFRDVLGRTVMDTRLADLRPLGPGGPLLPQRIDAHWPISNSRLSFTTSGWRLLPDVNAEHPGFAFPLDRGEHFERIVDVDTELDNLRDPMTDRDFLVTEEELRRILGAEGGTYKEPVREQPE